jgi:hypothetical protein
VRVVDDRGHFGRSEPPVHGDVHRPHQRTAEEEVKVRDAVAIKKGKAIASRETVSCRRLRNTAGDFELLSPRSPLIAEHEHLMVRLFEGKVSDHPGDRVALVLREYPARRH